MSRINTGTLPNAALTICYLILIALPVLPTAASEQNKCDASTFRSLGDFRNIDPNNVWRGYGKATGSMECFTVDLPSAGSLIVEISVPGEAHAEPVLHFIGQQCDDAIGRHRPFRFRERYANRLEIDILEAGLFLFCGGAQDPDEILGDFKIASTFQPERFEKSNDPDEHEPDADPLDGGHQMSDNSDELEPDAEGFGPPPRDPASDHALSDRHCDWQHTDDHGDTFHCATPVDFSEPVINAEIRNEWSDDQDLFVFHVEELSTVYIEMTSGNDLLAILYDHSGNPLSRKDDPKRESRSRIVKTLGQGWYFIRVEGRFGAEGIYQLTTGISIHKVE